MQVYARRIHIFFSFSPHGTQDAPRQNVRIMPSLCFDIYFRNRYNTKYGKNWKFCVHLPRGGPALSVKEPKDLEKRYLDINVYEALQQRFDFIFQRFDNVYVSFSGGKDSGLLLHLLMDYMKRNNIRKRIGVFHQDFEAQYHVTTEYVEKVFEMYLPRTEPYWVCLPMAVRTALSNYQMYWYPWDDKKKDIWVRPLPNKPYVIHMGKNPFSLYNTKCWKKTWPNSSADGTVRSTPTATPSVCWACAPTNP